MSGKKTGGDSGDAQPTAMPEAKTDTGDHAWMLISSALVLMMTAPGLALFYCGLVRKKNVLSVMMQCIFLMGLLTVVWGLWGYSLSFGGNPKDNKDDSMWIGNGDYLCMKGVQPTLDVHNKQVYPMATQWSMNMPKLTHMLYQGMFFIITPGLICGAFAERMKFSTMVVFMVLWSTIVYCPLAHWVWNFGILSFDNPNAKFKALDFAGGTVVHISSGVSALLCALVMGKRLGYGSEPMPPHNLTYTTMGAAMLWVGWFGFNAGSAGAANGQAASAFCATHFAAASGALTWAVIEWLTRGKPSVLGACSGAVAGLVCITPAAGYVQPMSAFLMGVVVSIVCFTACTALKSKFKYDDSLDAFGVHGVGGTVGAILTGVFATQVVKPDTTEKLGLLEGGNLLMAQLGATAITWGYTLVCTFVILKVLDLTMGLRVSQQDEIQGLDVSQHGEEGYIFI